MQGALRQRPAAGVRCRWEQCRAQQPFRRPRSRDVLACVAAAVTDEITEEDVKPVVPMMSTLSPGQHSKDCTSFKEQYRIRGYEAGPDQRANILTIANLLQEVGANHGVCTWGRSAAGLAALPGLEHLVFVATRMQITMTSYPKWGDVVQLETYYAEESRLSVRRDWRITDAATGAQLGAATSTWVTINMETRKLAKLPDTTRQKFIKLSPQPVRHVLPVEQTKRKLPDFPLPGAFEGPVQVARRTDMDANGHINNVTYLAWAMETMPLEIYRGWRLADLEIDFKAECHEGDEVVCLGQLLPAAGEAVAAAAAPAAAGSNGTSSSAGSNGNGASSSGRAAAGATASSSAAPAPAAAASSNGTAAVNGHANGSSAANGSAVLAAPGQLLQRQYLHTLRKRDAGGGMTEVWRARTTWVPDA